MEFLTFAYDLLKYLGIFPSRDPSEWKWRALNVYRAIIFVVTALFTTLMTIQMFVTTDLTILARTIDIWTMFLTGLYKWFCMSLYHTQFSKLSTDLVEIQVQGSMAYGRGRRSADEFTAKYLKPVQSITFWYMFSGMVAVGCIVLSPLLTYPKGDRSDFEYYNNPTSYPLSFWMPFNVDEFWMFCTIFVCHSISLAVVVCIYLGIDSYMFGAIYNIGGQIQLLNSSLINIKNSLEEIEGGTPGVNQVKRYTERQQTQCYSILRECVRHHILILNYIKRIHTLFNTLIIFDYLHGLTSVTFALFQLTISHGIGEKVSVIGFIFMSVWHQFLNNFFGEFIIQKQLSVNVELYNVPWWRAGKNVRQLLTLMIARSIRPTFITGYYMYKLSYESFIAFVKALYTYYMVLRRVNLDEKNV